MIGNLGLFRHLSALSRAPRGSAADLNKRVSRLTAEGREKFKLKRAEWKAKEEAFRADRQKAYEELLSQYGLPPRPDYRKERKVVAAFVMNEAASEGGISTDGRSLKVGGSVVASRESPGSKFMKVCPGKFGTDVASRRAANAVLDILGAGVAVQDRDSEAFLRARHSRVGRIVSPEVCYTVEVSKRITKRASGSEITRLDVERAAAFAPGGEIERYYAEQAAREEARLMASQAMDGLGRYHRR